VTSSFDLSAPVRGAAEQRRLERIDAAMRKLAVGLGAEEAFYPTLIARPALERAGYPEAFPHLLLAAAALQSPEGEPAELLHADNLAAPQWCLSPAVCYHTYANLAGRRLDAPLMATARGRCFRGEAETRPGVRQIEFEMREIVLIGEEEWVRRSADDGQAALEALARRCGLAGDWQPAEDPFFLPRAQGKALMQRLLGLKVEYAHGPDGLALASVNRHGLFFGQRFDIRDRAGRPVHTACVAAGLDRWAASAAITEGELCRS
jgi:seryl-tRNA synthetase